MPLIWARKAHRISKEHSGLGLSCYLLYYLTDMTCQITSPYPTYRESGTKLENLLAYEHICVSPNVA